MLDLMFSEDLGQRSQELADAFLAAEKTLKIVKVSLPFTVPEFFSAPSRMRFRRALHVLDTFIQDVIALRRSSAEPRSDLLAMYLAARDEETGNGLSDQLLRDEMMTLLSAGHETVSDAMTWTFYELMRHPDLYDRLLEEADREPQSTMPPSDGGTGESFAGMAFQEGLRLYPPGWGFLRAAIEQDAILSFRIPAGSRLILSPYVIHRDPAIWDEPDRFDPDRFSSGQTAGRHRFAWFPFSGGPRQCIGAGLAMMEAQMTLLGVSQAVRLQLEPGQTIRPLPRVSLKPDGPIWVRATLRNTSA